MLGANEIVWLIHTWQVTWIRLLIMIWRMYCGNTFQLAEWLVNFEVKKTIISCTTRGEKVHWWRPAGLIMVLRGEPAFPGVLSKLTGLCLPHEEAAARPWSPVPCSLLLGTRRSGSVSGATSAAWLQKGCWGEESGGQAAGESALKNLLSILKKIAVMFSFGSLAMTAELYSLLGIKS